MNKLYLLTIISIIVVTSSILIVTYAQNLGSQVGPFPENLGGMRLVQSASGDEALGAIRELHSSSGSSEFMKIEKGYTGVYRGNEGRMAYFWIAYGRTPDEVQGWLDLMTTKIDPGDGFTLPEQVSVPNASPTYRVEGYGMSHYYYVKSNGIYWIALDGYPRSEELNLVEEAVRNVG